MIANVQCVLPARLHKLRHVQLILRHDNNLPTKRIRRERVSFLTNTVTVLIHPHIWLVKAYLCRQKRPNRYFDSDSFRRRRHQEHSRFQRSRHGRQRRDYGRPKPITGQNGTKRSRAERIVVCCKELFCAIIRNKLCRRPKQRAFPRTCVSFSWTQRRHRN